MEFLVWVAHMLTAIAVVVLVLLQHGKGADMGAAFGSGSSGSVFGATGSANFLSRTTAVLAAVFFATSLGLAYFSTVKSKPAQLQVAPITAPTAPQPAAPANGLDKSGAIPQ
jgi:preprotein translocase subunit SecG